MGGDPAMINQNNLISLSFGKMGDTGEEGVILRYNLARHCFVLRDLIPMVVKLKMCATAKLFAKTSV